MVAMVINELKSITRQKNFPESDTVGILDQRFGSHMYIYLAHTAPPGDEDHSRSGMFSIQSPAIDHGRSHH